MRRYMVFVLLMMSEPAIAQPAMRDRPIESVPPPTERKACAEHNVQGQGDTPQTQGVAPKVGELGQKLAQSGGVICPPPDLDPAIRAPAPGGGQTPVIPPPAPGEGAKPSPQ
jgi:hypothetical protein